VCDQCACPTLPPGLHQRCFRKRTGKAKAQPCCQALCDETHTRCQRAGQWSINLCPFFGQTTLGRWVSKTIAELCAARFNLAMIDFGKPKKSTEICCRLCTLHAREYLRRMLRVLYEQWALKRLTRAMVTDMIRFLFDLYPGLVDEAMLDDQLRIAFAS